MKRRIKINNKICESLMKIFGVSDMTVWNALSYKRGDLPLHQKIRIAALEQGGVPVVELEGLETWYSGSPYSKSGNDHVMHQSLPNGASLEARTADGTVAVYRRGKLIRRFENVRLAELNDIQKYAAAL